MKGDFTRTTFDPANHFLRVLMQQGRVQMDADWNEQIAILLHCLRMLATDLGGPYWGPRGELGFEIRSETNDGGNFIIGRGRYYVDGLLVENEEDIAYLDQIGFIDDELPELGKSYYAYLDVWERHVTYVQMDHIRDAALGVSGPDTSTRSQLVWQVNLVEIPDTYANRVNCEGAEYWVNSKRNMRRPWLRARLAEEYPDNNACAIPPDSLYRGTENQLYRIEVHRPGVAWDGITDADGLPAGNVADAATFKWSGNNGSEVYAIKQQRGNSVTVHSLGRDARTALTVGDWVEILDDSLELRGKPGILAQVEAVDSLKMNVALKLPDDVDPDDERFRWPTYQEEDSRHPLLRRWGHDASEGAAMSEGAILITEGDKPDDGWLSLEHGIEVQFQPNGDYHTADYWETYARVGMRRLGWPFTRESDGSERPKALPAHGVEHHYAPLGVIVDRAVTDRCRCTLNLELDCADEPEEA